ncbi:mCG144953, partial [Mus musculus]
CLRWKIPNRRGSRFVIRLLTCLFVYFKAGFRSVAMVGPVLATLTRVASNSQRSTCLCFPSAGVKGLCDCARLPL